MIPPCIPPPNLEWGRKPRGSASEDCEEPTTCIWGLRGLREERIRRLTAVELQLRFSRHRNKALSDGLNERVVRTEVGSSIRYRKLPVCAEGELNSGPNPKLKGQILNMNERAQMIWRVKGFELRLFVRTTRAPNTANVEDSHRAGFREIKSEVPRGEKYGRAAESSRVAEPRRLSARCRNLKRRKFRTWLREQARVSKATSKLEAARPSSYAVGFDEFAAIVVWQGAKGNGAPARARATPPPPFRSLFHPTRARNLKRISISKHPRYI
ncbi:hypothetical protein B0H16DRAFT_1474832 [Mycena metata]|uniref:Uncharacterized protein n=1 Tax=Mycena metata TaxID=1033252 RepID=A0AAD7MIV7_9AGAR|nr:hypothetical protein B0H16DRAFT_1474832 [Mycena metata]